jgi:RNA polymerase sigma factor (sigma-70 family)
MNVAPDPGPAVTLVIETTSGAAVAQGPLRMSYEQIDALIHECLPLAARGDQRAFGRIVEACKNTVTAIALAIVRDVQVSEDIAQEAFLSAWQNLSRLRAAGSFLPWLRQITRNLALSHLRTRGNQRSSRADLDDVLAVVADPQPGHADRLQREHEEFLVAQALDELPEESREVLLIYYREGQNSRQVAELLGMQEAAVRKRLQRARDRVRDDVFARLGEAARATAPTAVFTAVLVASLVASPTASAAALAGGAAAASKGMGKFFASAGGASSGLGKWLAGGSAGASKGMAKFALGVAGGILLALIGGILGVLLGVRRYWVSAIDAEEKRALAGFAAAGIGLVVVTTAAFVVSMEIGHWSAPMLVFAALIAAMGAFNLIWLPRILARRRRLELERDPRAAERHREEHRQTLFGVLLGLVLGGLGLSLGLWMGTGL